MGAGIAYLCAARAGTSVTIKEPRPDSLDQGMQNFRELIDGRVRRGRMTREESETVLGRVNGALDFDQLRDASLVVEAVFEDRDLKRGLLAEVEALEGEARIFASNTSSIPITEIAAGCRRPANVIGMHYFSPRIGCRCWKSSSPSRPPTMLRPPASPTASARARPSSSCATRAGSTRPRILAPYLNEAAQLLTDGVTIESVDRALVDFGFPVGPLGCSTRSESTWATR